MSNSKKPSNAKAKAAKPTTFDVANFTAGAPDARSDQPQEPVIDAAAPSSAADEPPAAPQPEAGATDAETVAAVEVMANEGGAVNEPADAASPPATAFVEVTVRLLLRRPSAGGCAPRNANTRLTTKQQAALRLLLENLKEQHAMCQVFESFGKDHVDDYGHVIRWFLEDVASQFEAKTGTNLSTDYGFIF